MVSEIFIHNPCSIDSGPVCGEEEMILEGEHGRKSRMDHDKKG